jgi:3'-phosphoadenosine 5'-phosphosulfate sulfotransferase (PAPS reductase)/FAD synthetase
MGYEQTELALYEPEQLAERAREEVDPHAFDRIVVFFSGGKDSIACVLHLLDLGVPPEKIHLHHHKVDGDRSDGNDLMDWPITEAYCQAFADAFGMRIDYSWRIGGFEREMLRNGDPTAPTLIPVDGQMKQIGGEGPPGQRRKFPQVSADLSVRWCSAYCKIMVGSAYLTNHPMFLQGKTLVVTGERAEESKARSKYQAFEPHRSDNRTGARVKRWIDHWRPVHQWSEHQVWDIIRRYRVAPHPAYLLGWGRTSCMLCIFGNSDQWASAKAIAPQRVQRVSNYEQEFKITIHRQKSVDEQAACGTPYTMDPAYIALALSTTYDQPILVDNWVLPAGAFGEGCGPT